MIILEDVAQKAQKHEVKRKYFESQGIEIARVPLPIGDYVLSNEMIEDVFRRKEARGIPVKKMDLLGTYKVCVDTKFSIGELYSDLIQQHTRFRDEAILSQNNGIKLYILVENKDGITCVEDMVKWKNPRMFQYRKAWRMAKVNKEKEPKPPASNVQLIKIMHSMSRDYGISFLFCKPQNAGRRVIELLKEEENK